MRYALISDIHGNLEALEAVLQEARRRQAESYICLGDIVGYGADPRECLKKVRQLGALAVLGNHDGAVCDRVDLGTFNDYARQAVIWTGEQLGREETSYLAGLPLVRRLGPFVLAHGSLDSPERWNYIVTFGDAFRSFELLEGAAGFIGHSHVPFVFSVGPSGLESGFWKRLELAEGNKYLINVGSVGQPRDGDPRASFALLDLDQRSVELLRVDYDITTSQGKILDAGLPEFLAYRLAIGK